MAMEGFADGLRREMEDFNVSVSIIQPGYVKSAIFEKSAADSTLPPEKKIVADTFYPRYYDDKIAQRMERLREKAADPVVTSTAIYHAISSPYPKTRYPVANVDDTPVSVISWMAWLLPDRIFDSLSRNAE